MDTQTDSVTRQLLGNRAAVSELERLSPAAREVIEHIVGNGLQRLRHTALRDDPKLFDRQTQRIVNELMAAGFWPARRLFGK